MIGRIEQFFRRWRRRVSRSEWAIRLLGLPVSEGTGMEPGLLLVQIDGLSRQQMERAMKRGQLPFLQKLIQREHYEPRTFYSGLPSSTPAVLGELYYGEQCAVPSFSFFDSATHRAFTMFTPECAKEVEARLQKCGPGLLAGGSCWSTIYRGGATDEESHFCSACMGLRDLFRSRPLVRLLTFPIFHFASLLKIAGLLMVEFFTAVVDMFDGVAAGESLYEELLAVFKRVFICVGLRELLSIGVKIDLARGLPIIHVNFLGYDEQSHRRGPSSAYAHWSLAGIDRAIKNIYRAAQRSARRDYQVWFFSDHGHEATQFFDRVQPGGLEAVINAALDGVEQKSTASRRSGERNSQSRVTGERSSQRGLAEWIQTEVLTLFQERPFTFAALGPVGHVYLKTPLTFEQKRAVAGRLIREGGVPSVLVADDSGKVEWIHARGDIRPADEGSDSLPHPPWVKRALADDLEKLAAHSMAGNLILLGWGPGLSPLTFANERGSHGGPGPAETQGFALLPGLTRLPEPGAEFLRPTDLRAAILHYLNREPLPSRRSVRNRPAIKKLRVMTYNVHGCHGMDGRTSPRRIASVIERYHPDLVALQELDFGRVRSQRHDQPRLIAEELGMHVAFCPTVIDHSEQYGHALLSFIPMEVIRTEILSRGASLRHAEPRGALWVKLDFEGRQLNLMNTHFGLRRSERLAQAADLLNPNWIGAIGEEDALILCGDFNMTQNSPPYRALTARLRDVQRAMENFSPRNTFSTQRPFTRIDHIFVSRHFRPKEVLVPRNHLTRVASDHLPLIVDLEFQDDQS